MCLFKTVRNFSILFFFASCGNSAIKGPSDTPKEGSIRISADESIRPVIDDLTAMYMSLYPGTSITVNYKPESDCFRDIFRDSATRLIVVSRGLSPKEEKSLKDSMGYAAAWQLIARDAVAVIVHPSSADSAFTIADLKNGLTGAVKGKRFVFDGKKSTATVRFIRDSIMRGAGFDTAAVMAASGTKEVIEYVSSHANAVGLIGISWIANPQDSGQLRFSKKIKTAYIQCEACENKPFVRPLPETIARGRYPLTRNLYYILRENHNGLGAGFAGFLKFEQGQLIFRRSYLRPVMDFDTRNVNINIISD